MAAAHPSNACALSLFLLTCICRIRVPASLYVQPRSPHPHARAPVPLVVVPLLRLHARVTRHVGSAALPVSGTHTLVKPLISQQ